MKEEKRNMEPSDDLSNYDQHNKSNLSETYEDYYSNAIDTKLFEKYYKNRSVSDTAFWTLVVSYSVLITVGTLGNLFVMSAVIRNNSKYLFLYFGTRFGSDFGRIFSLPLELLFVQFLGQYLGLRKLK